MIDFKSPDWNAVVEMVTEKISNLDRENRKSLDPVKTAELRGEIRALEWLLQAKERQEVSTHQSGVELLA